MNKRDLAKLQKMIDAVATAHECVHLAEAKLAEFCTATYGATPADVDADEILDAVYGLCGVPNGMTAADFDRTMKAATK